MIQSVCKVKCFVNKGNVYIVKNQSSSLAAGAEARPFSLTDQNKDKALLASAVSLETNSKLSRRKTKESDVVSLSRRNQAAVLIPCSCPPSGERQAGPAEA